MKTFSKEIRDQYDHRTIHPEVIDMAYGFLKHENASEEAKVILEESGLKPYIKSRDDIIGEIKNTTNDLPINKLLEQNTYRNIELSTILGHLLQTKKPLSYKLIEYDNIKLHKPQKFITAVNNIFGPLLDDITLITGTGDELHAKHLTRFVTDHVSIEQGIRNNGDMQDFAIKSRVGSSIHTLKGGWFEKKSKDSIHVYGSSGGYGMTSNVIAGEIFRNLFPNYKITTDTK